MVTYDYGDWPYFQYITLLSNCEFQFSAIFGISIRIVGMKNNVSKAFKQVHISTLRYIVLRHKYYLLIVTILFRPFVFFCYVNLYYMYNVHCIFSVLL
jgi:hypothetical protein